MYHGKQVDPFYKTPAWRRARREALERDHWMCQDCLAAQRAGAILRPRAATVVHHIVPIDQREDLRLELSNLVSLCEACHNKRHPEKGGHGEERPAPPVSVRIIKV